MLTSPALRAPIAVSLGAISGALCRYYVGIGLIQVCGLGEPWAILVINFSGCVGMGIIVAIAANRNWFTPELLTLLTTGFLGSYTTFSTYALDAQSWLTEGRWMLAISYGLGSPGLGGIGLIVGIKVVAWLVPPPPDDSAKQTKPH